MKIQKLHFLFVLALLAGTSCCRLKYAQAPNQSYPRSIADFGIPVVDLAPRIDGQQGDPAWGGAICLNDFTPMGTKAVASANLARAWLCRDADFLYLALLAEHDSPENARSLISGHDGPIWEDDDLEIFLDPVGDGLQYYHVLANTEGAIHDHFVDARKNDMIAWDSGAVSMGSRTDQAYYIEMAIPLLSMNLTDNRLPLLGVAIGRGIPYNRDFKKVLGGFHQPSTWTYFPLAMASPVKIEDFSYSAFEGESPFQFQLQNLEDRPLELSGTFNGQPVSIHLAETAQATLNTTTSLTVGQSIKNELILKGSDGREVLRWYRVLTPLGLLSVTPLSDLIYDGEDVTLSVTINDEADSELLVIARDQQNNILKQITVQPEGRQFWVSLPFSATVGTITCHYKKASQSFEIQTLSSPWGE